MMEFEFGVYTKPGNAYAYLPYGSYHSRHVFRVWFKQKFTVCPHTQATYTFGLRSVVNLTIIGRHGAILHAPLTPHLARFHGISEASCWSQM